jgi:hypothetical protein
MRKLFFTFVFVLVLAPAVAADVTWDFKLAGGGLVKPGRWSFGVVKIKNPGSGPVRCTLVLYEQYSPEFRVSKTLTVPPTSVKKIPLYFKPFSTDKQQEIIVELTPDGSQSEKKKCAAHCVSPGSALVLIAGASDRRPVSTGIQAYLSVCNTARVSDDAAIAVSVEDLPASALGYDMVHTLVLGNVNVKKIDTSRRRAMRDYVSSGGRLVILGGGEASHFKGSFIEELAGVKVKSFGTISTVDAFPRRWSSRSIRREGPAPPPSAEMSVCLCHATSADVLISHAGAPLAYRRRIGLGEVVFTAFDTSAVKGWGGLDTFWGGVLARTVESGRYGTSERAEGIIQGKYLPKGVERSFGILLIIFFLTIIYALIIGPGNYVFLKKKKKFHLAYHTFVGIIAAATVLAYLGSTLFIREHTKVDYLAYVNVPDGRAVSGGAFFSVFSPFRGYVTINADNGSLPAWESRTEFGGLMSREDASLEENADGYTYKRLFRSQETCPFHTRFFGRETYALDFSFDAVSRQSLVDGKLKDRFFISGHFKNPLPFSLDDAFLATGGPAPLYTRLGNLPAGKRVDFKGLEITKKLFPTGRNRRKMKNRQITELVGMSFCAVKPKNRMGDDSVFHLDLCAAESLRARWDGVIIGFARNRSPFETRVQGKSVDMAGYTVVRFPVTIAWGK